MLDITTVFVFVVINGTVQAIIWSIAWWALREIKGLDSFAIGYSVFALGLWLTVLRPVAPNSVILITASNVAIIAGTLAMADGLARLLQRPRRLILSVAQTLFALAYWPIALFLAPDDIGGRAVVANTLSTIAVLQMIASLWGDRGLPRPLRGALLGMFFVQIGFLTVRSLDTMMGPAPTAVLFQTPVQTLYFFELNLFMTFLFLSLLLVVGLRLAQDLRMRNDELAGSLRSEIALRQEQRQLIGMVSHEFRSPLVAIDRAAEMIGMLTPQIADTVADRVTRIRESVSRLVGMIDRLLTIERVEQETMRRESVDLRDIVENVRRHFEGLNLSARLIFAPPPNGVMCVGDREMLITILQNLVDNALKYSPAVTTVDIAVRSDGRHAIATVKDRGVGIPQDELDSIGKRFFRASTAGQVTGTGLGMYIVRRLVERLDGRISIQSELGQGTIVNVRLPRVKDAADASRA